MKIKFHAIILVFVTLTIAVGCAIEPMQDGIMAVPLRPVATTTTRSNTLRSLASRAAYKHGIDHKLFHALVKHESAWDPYAVSRKGARGLTQIMPRTGLSQCGLRRSYLFNPELNLNCGAFYFSKLLRRFKNVKLALAAYNSGEGRVARLGRVPRIRETQRYVKRVMKSWQRGR